MGSKKMAGLLFLLAAVGFTLFLYAIGILVLGLAIFPGVYFLYQLWNSTVSLIPAGRLLVFSFGFVAAYFFSGFILMLLVGLLSRLFQLKLNEGEFKFGSPELFRWVFINAFFLVVKITFMDFILLTPICALFFRLMGARLGRNVSINSKCIADLSLLEIGDNSVIGGNATVICHAFERGGLKLKRVKIGRNVVIGLNSVIFPGAEIGDNSIIAAGAIVPKDTKIAAGSVYLGIK